MTYRVLIPGLILLAGLAVIGQSSAAGVTQGAMLSNSCAGCHGTGGKSPGAIPSINGKTAQYISQALIDFRDGERPSTVMQRHAKGYTDSEIQMIGEFFATQK